MKRLFYFLSLMLVLSACSLFEYHPYEIRLTKDERNLNAKAIQAIGSLPAKDTLTFLLLGDTQRFYDETEDFVKSANLQEADFVLLAGDISDFGLDKEFQWINEILSGLNKPYIGVIGNHDLSGEGEGIFARMYGPLNDSFLFNGVKFIMINTNSLEYNNNGKVPNVPWLAEQLNDKKASQAVVIGHVPPFDGDFDKNLEVPFHSTIQQSGKVRLNLFAHQHHFSSEVPYVDGIRYLVTTSIADKQYLKIKIWNTSYSYETIVY